MGKRVQVTIRRSTVAAFVLLGGMAILLVTTAVHDAQTVDEAVHLSAGYSYWKTGDFRLNPEHPPLFKLLAAAPLLLRSVPLPLQHTSWDAADQWTFGRVFLYENDLPPDLLLLLGRLPLIAVTLILGWAIFWWSRTLFGPAGGILSVFLFATDPIVLAHGHLVTTDVGFSLFVLLCILSLWSFTRRPSWSRWAAFVASLAGAFASKFSATFLLPLLVLIGILLWWRRTPTWSRLFPASVHRRRTVLIVFIVSVLAIGSCLWALYGFELHVPAVDRGVQRLFDVRDHVLTDEYLASAPFTEHAFASIVRTDTVVGRGIEWGLKHVPVPAFTYVRGLANVITHNYFGHESYFLGDRSLYGGWPMYFPYALLVKTPLITLVLIVATIVAYWRILIPRSRGWLRTIPRHWLFLTLPPVLYLLWSTTSSLNLGVRHMLPVLPFGFVLVGALPSALHVHSRALRRAVWTAVVVIGVGVTIARHPHHLSSFNGFAFGTYHLPLLLKDSNIDWGQELKHASAELRARGITSPAIAYFGQEPADRYGLTPVPAPTNDDPASLAPSGPYLVSISALLTYRNEYGWLLNYTPTEQFGNAMFLYEFPLRENTR